MSAQIDGQQFVFGFDSADAPTGVTGFFCRGCDIREEPEVKAMATDGYGQVEAVAVSKVAFRMKTGSFVGYIDKDTFDAAAAAATGQLVFLTETYFVKSVSEPRRKGDFTEVTIEAEHLPLVV